MAIPGFNFFSKKIKYQRFHYDPRYYDPIKEEVKERERRIKRELKMGEEEREQYRSNLRGAFKRTPASRDNSGFIRLLIIGFMVGGAVLYWNYGNDSLYFLLLPVLVFYLIIKFKLI